MTHRRAGVGLIVLGFLAAVLAGGWLAGRAAQRGTATTSIVFPALILFIPVVVLVGGGIYLYQRHNWIPETESEVQQQRHLVDIVNARGHVSVDDLAAELQISPQTVYDLIEQLIVLEIFAGEVDWDTGMIYSHTQPK